MNFLYKDGLHLLHLDKNLQALKHLQQKELACLCSEITISNKNE